MGTHTTPTTVTRSRRHPLTPVTDITHTLVHAHMLPLASSWHVVLAAHIYTAECAEYEYRVRELGFNEERQEDRANCSDQVQSLAR